MVETKYGVLWKRHARKGWVKVICENKCCTYDCDQAVFDRLNSTDTGIVDGVFVEIKINTPASRAGRGRVTQLREVKLVGRIHLRKKMPTVKVPVLPLIRLGRQDNVVESTLKRKPDAPTAFLSLCPGDRQRSFRHKQRVAFSLVVVVRGCTRQDRINRARMQHSQFLDVYPVKVKPHNPKLVSTQDDDPLITYYKETVAPPEERQTCWHWQQGKCRYGASCRNHHTQRQRSDTIDDWLTRRTSSARGNLTQWLAHRESPPRLQRPNAPAPKSTPRPPPWPGDTELASPGPGRGLMLNLNFSDAHRVGSQPQLPGMAPPPPPEPGGAAARLKRPSRVLERASLRPSPLPSPRTAQRQTHLEAPALLGTTASTLELPGSVPISSASTLGPGLSRPVSMEPTDPSPHRGPVGSRQTSVSTLAPTPRKPAAPNLSRPVSIEPSRLCRDHAPSLSRPASFDPTIPPRLGVRPNLSRPVSLEPHLVSPRLYKPPASPASANIWEQLYKPQTLSPSQRPVTPPLMTRRARRSDSTSFSTPPPIRAPHGLVADPSPRLFAAPDIALAPLDSLPPSREDSLEPAGLDDPSLSFSRQNSGTAFDFTPRTSLRDMPALDHKRSISDKLSDFTGELDVDVRLDVNDMLKVLSRRKRESAGMGSKLGEGPGNGPVGGRSSDISECLSSLDEIFKRHGGGMSLGGDPADAMGLHQSMEFSPAPLPQEEFRRSKEALLAAFQERAPRLT